MKKILILMVGVFLVSCSPNSGPQNPQNPQSPSEISQIQYSPSLSSIIVVPQDTLQNYLQVNLPPGQSSSVNLRIISQNISGEVKSLRSSSDLPLPQNCVKTYLEQEECVITVPISTTLSGLKVIRVATTQGNIFFLLVINRIPTGDNSNLEIVNSLNFGSLNESQSIIKLLTVKNTGAAEAENLQVTLQGPDPGSFLILYNSCEGKNLKPKKTCQIRVAMVSRGKTNGSYQASVSVSSQTQTIAVTSQGDIVNSSVVNHAPTMSASSLGVVAGQAEHHLLTSQDEDDDELTYSLVASDIAASVTSYGELVINALSNQIGNHQIVLAVSDGKSPATQVTIPVVVYPDMIYTGSTSFNEGAVQSSLFSVSFNLNQAITGIRTNLNEAATILKITGTGVSGITAPLLPEDVVPVSSGNGGNINYLFGGAIKYAGDYDVQFEVSLANGHKLNFHKTITVQPLNLPYIKYDMWAVKKSDNSVTGYNGDEEINSALEINREYASWRTPIFIRFINAPIVCNGQEMTDYDSANATQLACVHDKALLAEDAERGFIFRYNYSGANKIGGIANGTRKSFVVESVPWSHTWAHELGHQFGLWHTFETFWNDYLVHCTASDLGSCYLYNLYENINGRTLYTPGDWANYKVDYDNANKIIPFTYTAADDTSIDYFNGKVISLYENSTAQIFYPNPGGYTNGDAVVLYSGGQSFTSPAGSYACYQSFTSVQINGETVTYPVLCPTLPGHGANVYISNNTVKNTMSYWYHEEGSARFSTNQKLRMDQVLSLYPELTDP